MLYLAWHMTRRRIAVLLAVMCATLGGAAMVTGIGVLAESGWRSHAPVDRLATADVVVSGRQTLRPEGDLPIALPERARVPGGLVGRVAKLPGVAAAVGDRSFPASVVTRGGEAVPADDPGATGHGWSSTALLERPRITGTPPAGPHDVALDRRTAEAADVAPGDRVTVTAVGRPARYRVSAVVDTSASGLWFADATAARLTGHGSGSGSGSGSVDLIAVRAEPGAAGSVAAEVRRALRGSELTVSTGADRGDAEAPGTAAARSLLPALAGSLAGITLLVVGFIVGGALSVSIAAQRRELALMRAVGATPKQIRRLAGAQAAIIAVVAAVPGAALGYPLAERFRRLLVSHGMLPDVLPLTFSPLPAVAAVLLLIAVVWVAARGAAWRTSRRPATEAVAESRSEPRAPSKARAHAGLALIAVGTGASVTPLLVRSQAGAAATAMAGLLAAIGLALAGPALVGGVGRLLARKLPEKASAPTWLAVANSHGYALRSAAAISTLAMAVVFTLTYTLTQTTVRAATSSDLRDATRAQLGVSAPALGGVPADVLPALRDTPGVRAAAPVTSTTAVWTYRLLGEPEAESGSALVLTPEASGVLDLEVRDGSLAGLTGATVAVSTDVAGSRDAHVGSRVDLVLGDGARVTARVVATYARGLGFGPVVLSGDLAAGHTTAGLDQSVLVRTDGTEEARHQVAALVASRPGLALDDDRSGPGLPGVGGTAPELWINIAVLAVLLGYLLLGIANKLIATTTQRRTELAALRLIGAAPHQIRAMMRREAALISGLALITGLALSVVPLVLLSAGFLHRPWPAGPAWLAPAVAVVVAGIAFLTIELPTRQALRVPPAQALART
ncbi:ABC transporter permease [Streptomyces sp. NBRC 110028]|uniref:ABC transporter permease n=1 Tax=Streptomyces sp. NBRC 110028 TaxID=1621260 RepID=UPI0006E1828E|nr:ABC transporter permease [Streptomyces sp. NBRC 110028]